MDDIERMKRAARLIREVAADATDGTWKHLPGQPFEASGLVFNDTQAVCSTSVGNARHIAFWSPVLATTVATWLERTAADCADPLFEFSARARDAITAVELADAILGLDQALKQE